MNTYQPTFQSPIQTETVSGDGLLMTDLTGVPVILIQGDVSAGLPDGLPGPDLPGQLLIRDKVLLARLTRSEILLFGTEPEADIPNVAALEHHFKTAGSFSHATELTHGQAVIKLSGPAAAEALSKICGLNFADNAFPSGQVKQSSAAKIKTLIARLDDGDTPTYYLHVSRPFGQYFWDTLWAAAEEF